MHTIFSYVIKYDTGAAPNPFWGICTLTICKPQVRRRADINDWILGFGSRSVKTRIGKIDYSSKLVYAMKVTDKQSLAAYDSYCQSRFPAKIPRFGRGDWRLKVGDCIYDFTTGNTIQRRSVHGKDEMARDLSGKNSLLSNWFV